HLSPCTEKCRIRTFDLNRPPNCARARDARTREVQPFLGPCPEPCPAGTFDAGEGYVCFRLRRAARRAYFASCESLHRPDPFRTPVFLSLTTGVRLFYGSSVSGAT